MEYRFVCIGCHRQSTVPSQPVLQDGYLRLVCAHCGAANQAKYSGSAMGHPSQSPIVVIGLAR